MITKNKTSKTLVLGIDTGGTYTDGVLLDYDTHDVLASHKSLTTKRDFAIGIGNVMEAIDIQNPEAIQMVSISTTLATNAIAEGKGKRVALFLIGYDPELVASFQMENQFATPNFYYFNGGHDLYGQQKEELDLPAILEKTKKIKDKVDAIAVSSYFSPLNPEHENRIYKAISRVCDLPIVLGHQLSTKLGSVERATTAALNASLIAVLQNFIVAVRRAMEQRGIDAPLMVVRGDGTLMSDEFAARSPVETIHSGPAASAIGGRFLSDRDDALIVDVGGTTTDLALIQEGAVTISEDGASVSNYKTAVQAANLLSVGVGGDSHITIDRKNNIIVGPERVVPLAYLAEQYPEIEQYLQLLAHESWPPPHPHGLEHWFLLREPTNEHVIRTSQEKLLIDLLSDGPMPVKEIVHEAGLLHKNQLEAKELLRQEIIGKSGLTSTDLLHVDGRYTPWNVNAAQYGLTVLGHHLSLEEDKLAETIWSRITEMISQTIIEFLSERSLPTDLDSDDIGTWFFKNCLYAQHPHLKTEIQLKTPIIGIGAPAGIMLEEVGEALNTELLLPDYHYVANAVGAVVGSIMVSEEILIYPHLTASGLDIISYYVQARESRTEYEELEDALQHARELGQQRAMDAALRSGADNPQITVEKLSDGLDSYRVRVKAVGKPRLSK